MANKQLQFELRNYKSQIGKPFGGGRLKSHPKTQRPFSKKNLIHIVLKSSKAKGRWSFLHYNNRKVVDQAVFKVASAVGVEIRDYVNVGNHLHILIKASHRDFIANFLRALSGILPRKICRTDKGKPLGFQFWDARPFTKIIAEGLSPFQNIRAYFQKNHRQAQARVEGFDVLPVVNST